MHHELPITVELDLPDLLGVAGPPRRPDPTLELALESIDDDITLEEQKPVRHAMLGALAPGAAPARHLSPQEATALLRRAQSLFVSGAMTPGVVGATSARERFDHALDRAEKSPDHAAAAGRLRARAARAEGRVDDAICALKRALHSAYDPAATRAIFADLAELYAAHGERSEADYYAKRAARVRLG